MELPPPPATPPSAAARRRALTQQILPGQSSGPSQRASAPPSPQVPGAMHEYCTVMPPPGLRQQTIEVLQVLLPHLMPSGTSIAMSIDMAKSGRIVISGWFELSSPHEAKASAKSASVSVFIVDPC